MNLKKKKKKQWCFFTNKWFNESDVQLVSSFVSLHGSNSNFTSNLGSNQSFHLLKIVRKRNVWLLFFQFTCFDFSHHQFDQVLMLSYYHW